MVEYTYDAWGKPLSKTGSMANTLGALNPFRYRGYVYDEETGLYYLQSRYYNPEWGRFINGDSVLGKPGQLFSHNSFAYCNSSPINFVDANGHTAVAIAYEVGEILFLILAAAFGYESYKTSSANQYYVPTLSLPVEKEIANDQSTTIDIAINPTLNKTYPRSTAVHHIVARNDPRALPARRALETYLEYGVENTHNLVTLPAASHSFLHTSGYYMYVNIQIISAVLKGSSVVEKTTSIENKLDLLALELTGASLLD